MDLEVQNTHQGTLKYADFLFRFGKNKSVPLY